MIAIYTDPVKTPLTLSEAATAMRTALSAGRSTLVRDDQLALALAKSALETGRWRSMWNWNWGNVKAGPKYAGMYTCIHGVSEILDGSERWFEPSGEIVPPAESGSARLVFKGERYAVPPGHPQTRMRAYANRYDGAYEYVDALVRHFPRSYEALFGADPAAFVRALKSEGYFTAAEGPYMRAVTSLQHEFLRALRGVEIEETDHDWEDLRLRVAAQQFDPLEMARDEGGEGQPNT